MTGNIAAPTCKYCDGSGYSLLLILPEKQDVIKLKDEMKDLHFVPEYQHFRESGKINYYQNVFVLESLYSLNRVMRQNKKEGSFEMPDIESMAIDVYRKKCDRCVQ